MVPLLLNFGALTENVGIRMYGLPYEITCSDAVPTRKGKFIIKFGI